MTKQISQNTDNSGYFVLKEPYEEPWHLSTEQNDWLWTSKPRLYSYCETNFNSSPNPLVISSPYQLTTTSLATTSSISAARTDKGIECIEQLTDTIKVLSENIVEMRKQLKEEIASKEDLEKHQKTIIDKMHGERNDLIESLTKLHEIAQKNSIHNRALVSTVYMITLFLLISVYTYFIGPISIAFPATLIFLLASILFFLMARTIPQIKPLE